MLSMLAITHDIHTCIQTSDNPLQTPKRLLVYRWMLAVNMEELLCANRNKQTNKKKKGSQSCAENPIPIPIFPIIIVSSPIIYICIYSQTIMLVGQGTYMHIQRRVSHIS